MSKATPIVIVCGPAGSGKDTVASFMARDNGGVCVAQADPMKRFVAKVFGFTEQQLWGPSECRNQAVPISIDEQFNISDRFYDLLAGNEVLGDASAVLPWTKDRADQMANWFEGVYKVIKANNSVSARLVLQTFGTEFGRAIDPDMWSRYAIRTCKLLLAGGREYSREHGLTVKEGFKGYPFAYITDGRFRNEIVNVRTEGGVAVCVIRFTDAPKAAEIGGVAGHKSETELGDVPWHFYTDHIRNDHTLETLHTRTGAVMLRHYGE